MAKTEPSERLTAVDEHLQRALRTLQNAEMHKDVEFRRARTIRDHIDRARSLVHPDAPEAAPEQADTPEPPA